MPLLYPGKIVIPKPVYDELSYPTTLHLKSKIDSLVDNHHVTIFSIKVDSYAYTLYQKFTTNPDKGYKIIGPGEAATIALAKVDNGIVASNNLKDISVYIKTFELRHITTGDILFDALKRGFITEQKGNIIWASMLSKRRKIGASSFSDYINKKQIIFKVCIPLIKFNSSVFLEDSNTIG